MKELTVEQKAKAYDEAIAKARKEYKNHEKFEHFRKMLVYIFPELEENDDKKIRNSLISYFSNIQGFSSLEYNYGITPKEAASWLEKQGEHAKFRNKIQIGDKVTRNEDGILVNLSQLERVAKSSEAKPEEE